MLRRLFQLLPILAASTLVARAASARVPTHIACVGDSITAGFCDTTTGGPQLGSYPEQLKAQLAAMGLTVDVQNFGHGGATLLTSGDTPYIQQTEYTAATSYVAGAGPSAIVDVIIMLGTNDSKPQNWTDAGAGSFAPEYAALIDHFGNLATHPLVYVAIPPAAFTNPFAIDPTVLHDQISPLIAGVASQDKLPLIDVYLPTINHSELYCDGVHFTDPGYTVVATAMLDGLLGFDGGVPVYPVIDAGTPDSNDEGTPDSSDEGTPDSTVDGALGGGSSSSGGAGSDGASSPETTSVAASASCSCTLCGASSGSMWPPLLGLIVAGACARWRPTARRR